MPFDGSGNFNRVMNWVADAVALIKIRADRHDQEDDNFAAGLSNCITKDGQTQPTANIPLNAKRLVNVANAVNPQDALTLAQFTGGAVRYDAAQALTVAQQLQANTNLAATMSVAAKNSAFNLLASDRGKTLRIIGSCTGSLPAASSVGNDFAVYFRTAGGVLTLDPDGTDQIEGVNANYVIPDGCSGRIVCTGTAWMVNRDLDVIAVTVLTSGGTYPKPQSLKFLEVTVVGGAGGGGNAALTPASQSSAGGGGGAGGVASKFFKASDLGASTTYTVGAGGSGGGGAGTASTFQAASGTVTGGAGTGGSNGAASAGVSLSNGGAGGSASGGDLNLVGGTGGTGNSGAHGIALAMVGMGGANALAQGSQLRYVLSTQGGPTATGNFPGGGGGGAGNGASQGSGTAGGAGGAGAIILREYF